MMEDNPDSIFSNLNRAYDNVIVLREEIGSEALSYSQLVIYDMNKAKISRAPLIEMQRVIDNILAFWGNVNREHDRFGFHITGSVLTFLAKQDIVEYCGHEGYCSRVIEDTELVAVRTKVAGIFESDVKVGDEVTKGQQLARVVDPYEGEVTEILTAPIDGVVFFEHNDPLTYADTAVIKLIAGEAL